MNLIEDSFCLFYLWHVFFLLSANRVLGIMTKKKNARLNVLSIVAFRMNDDVKEPMQNTSNAT